MNERNKSINDINISVRMAIIIRMATDNSQTPNSHCLACGWRLLRGCVGEIPCCELPALMNEAEPKTWAEKFA